MDFQLFIFLAATTTALTVLTLITKRYGLGLLALPFCLAMIFAPFTVTQEQTFAFDNMTLEVQTAEINNETVATNVDEFNNTYYIIRAVNKTYPYKAVITLIQNPNASIVFANEKKYLDFATASAISSIYMFHLITILLQFWINVKEGTESMLRTGRWSD